MPLYVLLSPISFGTRNGSLWTRPWMIGIWIQALLIILDTGRINPTRAATNL